MGNITQILDWLCVTGGVIFGFMYGEIDPLMYSLIAMVALDCITGLAAAAMRKEVSSKRCFQGLMRKFLILLLVSVAHVIDMYVTNTFPVLQSAVMLFFIAHEALSIIENAALLGVPIPKKLLDVLAEINKESGGQATTDDIAATRADFFDDIIDDVDADAEEVDETTEIKCEEVTEDVTD